MKKDRKTTRVALIDDHALFRMGVAQALASDAALEVCATGGSADEAFDICEKQSPDVMLIDLSMPGGGLNAIARIRDAFPATRIAVLTVSEHDSDVLTALENGVEGYILKGSTATELVTAVTSIGKGERWVSPALGLKIFHSIKLAHEPVDNPLDALSKSERAVCDLIATGKKNEEISEALDISPKTVKFHITKVLKKLGLKNRVEIALLVERNRKS